MIVWAAVYLTWDWACVPLARLRQHRGHHAGLAVSVFAFNELAGTNYGYVNAAGHRHDPRLPGSVAVVRRRRDRPRRHRLGAHDPALAVRHRADREAVRTR